MEVPSGKAAKQKSDMFLRSLESEVEQLHGTLQDTNVHLARTNQELKMIKWCMFIVVIIMGLMAMRFGVF